MKEVQEIDNELSPQGRSVLAFYLLEEGEHLFWKIFLLG